MPNEFRIAITGEPEAIADIDRMMRPFNMRDGLAEEFRTVAVEGIQLQCETQADPDGNTWAQLHPIYEEWKSIEAPGKPIGRLYDTMLSTNELMGVLAVRSEDLAEQYYAVTAMAMYLADQFQKGGVVTGNKQPPRPFWGISQYTYARMGEISDARFEALFT